MCLDNRTTWATYNNGTLQTVLWSNLLTVHQHCSKALRPWQYSELTPTGTTSLPHSHLANVWHLKAKVIHERCTMDPISAEKNLLTYIIKTIPANVFYIVLRFTYICKCFTYVYPMTAGGHRSQKQALDYTQSHSRLWAATWVLRTKLQSLARTQLLSTSPGRHSLL